MDFPKAAVCGEATVGASASSAGPVVAGH